jgi:NitT/TauT family transport system permease protein
LYVEHARYTLEKIVIGGGIGVITGVFFGTLIYFVSLARVVAMPYIITIRVLPKIAIAPLLLIYFGTGMGTAVFLVALIAFFPMVVNTAAGLQQAPQRHRELLKSVDTGSLQLFYSLYIPYALPDVFAGLKQSVTLAVVGAILAEWIVIDNGLGHIILLGSSNLQADLMIAALLVLTALGLSVYAVVVLVQQQIFWTDPENLLESH